MIGGILFLSCVFVCLSVVNFNLRYNFWTVRDRDFIFGMHTPLMTPFEMTPRSMTLKLKITFFYFVAAGGIEFHKHTLIFIGYLLLPSCDITEILLKQRKTLKSTKPNPTT